MPRIKENEEEWEKQEREEWERENRWLIAKPGDEWLGDFGEPKGAIPLQMYD